MLDELMTEIEEWAATRPGDDRTGVHNALVQLYQLTGRALITDGRGSPPAPPSRKDDLVADCALLALYAAARHGLTGADLVERMRARLDQQRSLPPENESCSPKKG